MEFLNRMDRNGFEWIDLFVCLLIHFLVNDGLHVVSQFQCSGLSLSLSLSHSFTLLNSANVQLFKQFQFYFLLISFFSHKKNEYFKLQQEEHKKLTKSKISKTFSSSLAPGSK